MTRPFECILVSSALALAGAGCGGSNSPSNTPGATGTGPSSASEPSTTSEPTPSTQPPMASGATGSDSSGTPSSDDVPLGTRAAQLNDAQIAAITDSVNSAEIEQAQIAQTKSKNEQVRRFAGMMIEHHSQAKAQQAALKLPAAQSPLSQQLAVESHATLETLKAKNGADFDRAYLEAQVEGHREALDTIRNDLQPSAKAPELRSYLEGLTPKVAAHLEQAKAAQQALQTSGDESRSSSTTSSR